MRVAIATVLALGAFALPLSAGETGDTAAPPQLTARLLADRDAIAPGGEVTLAMELTISKPWHMYDPIVLDTGLGTSIKLDLPAGVTVTPWEFPTPHLKSQGNDDFKLEYLAHEGAFIALATARVAPNAATDKPLRFAAKVTGLACIEQCVKVDAEAALELPVKADGAAANADVFVAAKKKLPRTIDAAEFLEGSRLLVSHKSIPIGASGEIVLQIKVRDAHHIQHHDPGTPDLIPTRVFIEPVTGIAMKESEQVWPPPHVRDMPYIGKVNELNGTFVVRQPFKIVDTKFQPRPVRMRVLLQYQTCTDKGQCYQPEMAVANAGFEVVAADAKSAANSEYDALKLPALAAAVRGITDGQDSSTGGGTAVATPDGPNGPATPKPAAAASAVAPLWKVFLLAFLGGMLLNIMPCVLPVISLKILSFARQSGEAPGRIFVLGLMYAVGVLASFAVLAAVLVSTGKAWGGQMQNPTFVSVLAVAIFAFSLSLLGVFEIQLPSSLQRAASSAEQSEGPGGAFLNGVLATAVATPCTAPLLGSALGSLVTLPPLTGALGIMFIGLGLATPYVLLTAFPQWLRFLPKPGAWMETFKQIVGFVTLVVVVWLLWVSSYLLDRVGLFVLMLNLIFVGMACWMLGRVKLTDELPAVARKWSVSVALVVIGYFVSPFAIAQLNGGTLTNGGELGGNEVTLTSGPTSDHVQWMPWSAGIGPELARQGKTVYIDYTAKWCATCQVNKATVLHTDTVEKKFANSGVVAILADFTKENPPMFAEIRSHGRAGVPVNVIYPAGKPDQPILLPEFLTQSAVLDALAKAGASKAGEIKTAAR